MTQLDGYLKRFDLGGGTLVIFDRRPTAKDIDERTRFDTAKTPMAASSPSCGPERAASWWNRVHRDLTISSRPPSAKLYRR